MEEKRENYNEILGEQEFECICENCSKPFFGIDEEATLCPSCWGEILNQLEE